jgi:mannose-1-phosphate guanylyltransferase
MLLDDTFAVVMAGGSGTRFWPASRPDRPKQFLGIGGPQPMLAATVGRLSGLIAPERILVVAGERHAQLVHEVLPELPGENLLLEPVGRNTLACVALAGFEIERRSPDAVQIFLPADHVVQPAASLRASLADAVRVARARAELVVFGVRPTHPATGYGYVELGDVLEGEAATGARRVLRFVEKPDRARAETYLASGRFHWNSGMFVWSCSTLRAALFEHAPDVARTLVDASPTDLDGPYSGLPSLSMDVGILEKASNVCALAIDFDWNDVGSWAALPQVLPADADGHWVDGGARVDSLDSSGCVVHGPAGERIAMIGLRDLVIVRSGKTTLVCPRDRSEEVKRLVEGLAEEDRPFE